MLVVSFDKELREAFAAGQASAMAMICFMRNQPEAAECFAKTPKTYAEWIESLRHRPQIARGSATTQGREM